MSKNVRLIYYGVITAFMLWSLYKVYFSDKVDVVPGINEGLFLAAASVIIWIVASLLHTFSNIKKSTPALLGALAVLVIFAIAYATAKPVVLDKFPDLSVTTGKLVSGGLITVYILGAVALIGAFYSAIASVFKS